MTSPNGYQCALRGKEIAINSISPILMADNVLAKMNRFHYWKEACTFINNSFTNY